MTKYKSEKPYTLHYKDLYQNYTLAFKDLQTAITRANLQLCDMSLSALQDETKLFDKK